MTGKGRPVARPNVISARVTDHELRSFEDKCRELGVSRSAAMHSALKRWVMGKSA